MARLREAEREEREKREREWTRNREALRKTERKKERDSGREKERWKETPINILVSAYSKNNDEKVSKNFKLLF